MSHSITANQEKIVDLLIKLNVNVNLPDSSASKTASLHEAAYKGNLSLVKKLVGANAKIDIINIEGNSPLYFAASANKAEVINFLVSQGANVNGAPLQEIIEDLTIDINDAMRIIRYRKPPLHKAVTSKSYDSIEMLLKHNASVHVKQGDLGLYKIQNSAESFAVIDEYLKNDIEQDLMEGFIKKRGPLDNELLSLIKTDIMKLRVSSEQDKINLETIKIYLNQAETADGAHQLTAINYLANCYEMGAESLSKNLTKATRLYQEALARGSASAMSCWGTFLYGGKNGIPQNKKEGIRLWKIAAEHGHPPSHWNLGYHYFEEKNYHLSLDHFQKYLQFNPLDHLAYNYVATISQIKGNSDLANRYYTISANLGNERSKISLKNSEVKEVANEEQRSEIIFHSIATVISFAVIFIIGREFWWMQRKYKTTKF